MKPTDLRSRKKSNFYPKFLIIALLVVVLILSRATWNVFVKNNETKENLAGTEEDLEELKERESDLEEEIKNLSTARGIDREIREKFRVTKEGEEMIMLIDSPDNTSTTTDDQNQSLWSRIRDLF